MNEWHKNIKSKVLNELVQLMDERQVSDLKSKSPKFMKVETNDPEMAKNVVEEVTESAMPMEEEMPMESEPKEDMDMERLMEMYKQLK